MQVMVTAVLLVLPVPVLGEFCGKDFSLDKCATAKHSCGKLPAGATNLTLVGYTLEKVCIVADLSTPGLYGFCNASELVLSDGCLPNDTNLKPLECNIVTGCVLGIHLILLLLNFRTPEGSDESRKLQSGIYWWSHFWTGLFTNQMSIWYALQGQIFGTYLIVAKLMGFIGGGIFGGVVFEVGLRYVKSKYPQRWFLACWLVGLAFAFVGVRLAYHAGIIALCTLWLWPVNGLLQLALDFAGEVLIKAFKTWRAGGQPAPYDLLVSELIDQPPDRAVGDPSSAELVRAQSPGPGNAKTTTP